MHVLLLVAGIAVGGQARVHHIARLMARITRDLGVGAGQRKLGFLAMIEGYPAPAVGAVAAFAAAGEPALVGVILAVASAACGGRPGKLLILVAGLAGHGDMKPNERIIGEAVVEAHVVAPRHTVVTGFALLAELLTMHILLLVTVKTRQRQFFQQILAMTGLTLRGGVSPLQRKMSRRIVVELGLFPACCGVAAGAIRSELCQVNVLNLVAAVTIQRHALVDLTNMAGLANDLFMLVFKRELRLVVIKGLDRPPARFGMTRFACLA